MFKSQKINLILASIIVLGTILFLGSKFVLSQSIVRNFSGYAWSDNIGYISFDGNINTIAPTIGAKNTSGIPTAPIIGTVAAGVGQALVSFTPPVSDGGNKIITYTVTSNPGGLTGTKILDYYNLNDPIMVNGLSDGTAYTFTVTATNVAGTSPASGPSNSITTLKTVAGALAPRVDYGVSGSASDIKTVDFNGDSYLDLAIIGGSYTTSGHTFSIYMNKGDGTFAGPFIYTIAGSRYINSFDIGDFNNDSHPDIVVAHGAGFSIFTNKGNGSFATEEIHDIDGRYILKIFAGNFYNDPYLDLISDSLMFMNTGKGTFARVSSSFSLKSSVSAIGDFNNDSFSDLLTSISGGAQLYTNNGSGEFSAGADYISDPGFGEVLAVAIGDLNNDSRSDFVVANRVDRVDDKSGVMSVLINNGDGTFSQPQNYITGSWPQSVAIGDFNNDSYSDLAAAYNSANGNEFSVYINKGNGTFSSKSTYDVAAIGFAVGDFNNDSHIDLVSINAGNARDVFSVWMNKGQ